MIHLLFPDETAAREVVEAWSGTSTQTGSNGLFLDAERSLLDFGPNEYEADEPTWLGSCLVEVQPRRGIDGWEGGVEKVDAAAIMATARQRGIKCSIIEHLTTVVDSTDRAAE